MSYRIATLFLWLSTGLVVTLLAMRFVMRLLAVRDDVPVPGLVYELTSPLVQPLYQSFPVSDRLDYHATEAASLAAAGVVVVLAVGIYVVGLLAVTWRQSR